MEGISRHFRGRERADRREMGRGSGQRLQSENQLLYVQAMAGERVYG